MAPVEVSAEDLDLEAWIRPCAGVVWGQACAEPVPLVDRLIEQAGAIGGLTGFCGLTWRDALARPEARDLGLVSYGVLGTLRKVAAERPVGVVPAHFSELPDLFAERALPGEVALVQVAPPDADGRCSFGVGADYLADAVSHSEVVIAEVNQRMPSTRGAGIDYGELDVVVPTDRPLLVGPSVVQTETERLIAEHVASLVDDGDTVQLGVGALPEAIMGSLRSKRDLGIHSGMIADAVVDLVESGAVTGARKPTDRGLIVTGAALGTERLFEFLARDPDVRMRPVSYTHRADVLSRVGRLVAVNGAIEIDLTGQVNSEQIGTRRIGAVGGQVDFLRAARASGGIGVVALPATAPGSGASRLVAALSGPVTTARADVDAVVTEHGVARLRGLTLAERAAALIGIAAPEHREELSRDVSAAGLARR